VAKKEEVSEARSDIRQFEAEIRLSYWADDYNHAAGIADKVSNYACEVLGMEERGNYLTLTEILEDMDVGQP
jgi:hypothetical protein